MVNPRGFAFLLFKDEKSAKEAETTRTEVIALEDLENDQPINVTVRGRWHTAPAKNDHDHASASSANTDAAHAANHGDTMSDHGHSAPKAHAAKKDPGDTAHKTAEGKAPRTLAAAHEAVDKMAEGPAGVMGGIAHLFKEGAKDALEIGFWERAVKPLFFNGWTLLGNKISEAQKQKDELQWDEWIELTSGVDEEVMRKFSVWCATNLGPNQLVALVRNAVLSASSEVSVPADGDKKRIVIKLDYGTQAPSTGTAATESKVQKTREQIKRFVNANDEERTALVKAVFGVQEEKAYPLAWPKIAYDMAHEQIRQVNHMFSPTDPQYWEKGENGTPIEPEPSESAQRIIAPWAIPLGILNMLFWPFTWPKKIRAWRAKRAAAREATQRHEFYHHV
jgi:hypothetical protein